MGVRPAGFSFTIKKLGFPGYIQLCLIQVNFLGAFFYKFFSAPFFLHTTTSFEFSSSAGNHHVSPCKLN